MAIYTHKDPAQLLRQLDGERIHRAEFIELYSIDRSLLDALTARLERRMSFELSVSHAHLYLTLGGQTLSGAVERHAIAAPP